MGDRSQSAEVNGRYVDGLSSRQYPVRLTLTADQLHLVATGFYKQLPRAELTIDTTGDGGGTVSADDGGVIYLEPEAMQAFLRAWGKRPLWFFEAMPALLALALMVVAVAAAAIVIYFWGLPPVAEALAKRLPPSLASQLSQSVLKQMDEQLFSASALPLARQAALRQRLLRFHGLPATNILFRKSRIGANALALPDGTIIVADELVGLASDDREIDAVVLHEVGHVAEYHGMRQLIQGALVGTVIAVWVGDIGWLSSTLTATLLQNNYSRNFELEADRYAALTLKTLGESPQWLVIMLKRLSANEVDESRSGEGSTNAKTGWATLLDLFDTHPDLYERIDQLDALSGKERARSGAVLQGE